MMTRFMPATEWEILALMHKRTVPGRQRLFAESVYSLINEARALRKTKKLLSGTFYNAVKKLASKGYIERPDAGVLRVAIPLDDVRAEQYEKFVVNFFEGDPRAAAKSILETDRQSFLDILMPPKKVGGAPACEGPE